MCNRALALGRFSFFYHPPQPGKGLVDLLWIMSQSAAGTQRNEPPLFAPYVRQIKSIVSAANDKLDSLEHAALAKVERDAYRLKNEARKWAKSVCTPAALEQVHRAVRLLVFARLAGLSVQISRINLEEKFSWPVSVAGWAQVPLLQIIER